MNNFKIELLEAISSGSAGIEWKAGLQVHISLRIKPQLMESHLVDITQHSKNHFKNCLDKVPI